MRDTNGRWAKGTSGNPAGRPPRESSLVQILNSRLDRKVKGATAKQRLADVLIKEGLSGNVYAISRIFEICQRSFEFKINTEAMDILFDLRDQLEKEER